MMKRFFTPTGALVLFLLISTLALGGLTWVTVASLQVETAQREAMLRADWATRERLALWRMDSLFLPEFGIETNRPFAHYSALHTAFPAVDADFNMIELGQQSLGTLRFPSPLLSSELPSWMALHFQLDSEAGWESPQVLPAELGNRLITAPYWLSLQNVTPQRQALLKELIENLPKDRVLGQLNEHERHFGEESPYLLPAPVPAEPSTPKPSMGYLYGEARRQAPPLQGAQLLKSSRLMASRGGRPSQEPELPGTYRYLLPSFDLNLRELERTQKEAAAKSFSPPEDQRSTLAMGFAGPQLPPPESTRGMSPQSPSQAQSAQIPNTEYQKRDQITRSLSKTVVENIANAGSASIPPTPAVPSSEPATMRAGGGFGGGAGPGAAVANAPGAVMPGAPAPTVPSGGLPAPLSTPAITPPGKPAPGLMADKPPASDAKKAPLDVAAIAGGPLLAPREAAKTLPGSTPPTTRPRSKAIRSPAQTVPESPSEPMRKEAGQDGTLENRGQVQAKQADLAEQEKPEEAIQPWAYFAAERKAAPLPQPLSVHIGPLRPQWLSGLDGTHYLVLVRAARLEAKTVYQGIILDWNLIQQQLHDLLQDLFPQSKFTRILPGDQPNPERAMTTLPLQLDPGPMPQLPPAGWTTLRLGLALAWLAALIALLSVGFGGRALLDLSERRIRFVSAVTHELRTPLTSLRLYLDLLTSGMIEDSNKQKEYLQTLAHESERLNRLIENVLDFARLEKRSVQAQRQPVLVSELLDELSQTWLDRCKAEGKELLFINTMPADQMVSTDRRITAQILGNLIDNSRKYSHPSADPRIWVWSKPGERGRIIFEVEDRGPGVATRERGSIFRPFRRGREADTTAGGAGLGLALAKQWAEMLGGSLSYRVPEGGVGACFRLELPLG